MFVKKVVFFGIVVFLCFVINNLFQSLSVTWQKKDLVVKTKTELAKEKKKGEDLRKKIALVKRPDFTEAEARNKLFLVKPGEQVVMLPKGSLGTAPGKPAPQDTRPNWRKWWELFFTTTP